MWKDFQTTIKHLEITNFQCQVLCYNLELDVGSDVAIKLDLNLPSDLGTGVQSQKASQKQRKYGEVLLQTTVKPLRINCFSELFCAVASIKALTSFNSC